MVSKATSKARLLRSWYEKRRFFVDCVVNDALEARIAEAAEYDTVIQSGAGTAALCGLPDAGVTTLTEVVNNARYIANAVDIPLIVDADTGFGNIHMVRRTVQELIQVGAAGLFLEDQAELRRCGFIAGKEVLPLDEALTRYRAAVDMRNELDPDVVLMARTDARGAAGGSLDDAIHRAKAYRQAGMDVIYFEALQSLDEIRTAIAQVGPPIYFTFGAIPMNEIPSHEEMAEMGISHASYMVLRPLRNYARDRLMWEILHDCRQRGPNALYEWNRWAEEFPWKHPEPPHFHDFMGFSTVREVERRYLRPEEQEKYAQSTGLYTPGEGPGIKRKGVDWR